MEKLDTLKHFVGLFNKENAEDLIEASKTASKWFDVDNYYKSDINPDFYVLELTDDMKYYEESIEDVYLATGAIAIREMDTSGVFIEEGDIKEVNNIFGYSGGGAALLYSLLSGEERRNLIVSFLERKHPLLKIDEVFVRLVPNKSFTPSQESFGSEEWQDLESFSGGFTDDCIEVRSSDGMLLESFGVGSINMCEIMAMTGMECYIFDMSVEMYEAYEFSGYGDDDEDEKDIYETPQSVLEKINESILKQYDDEEKGKWWKDVY